MSQAHPLLDERLALRATPAAVLFDLDGTLIDSIPTYFDLMESILKVVGLPPAPRSEARMGRKPKVTAQVPYMTIMLTSVGSMKLFMRNSRRSDPRGALLRGALGTFAKVMMRIDSTLAAAAPLVSCVWKWMGSPTSCRSSRISTRAAACRPVERSCGDRKSVV